MKRSAKYVNGQVIWDPPFNAAEEVIHDQRLRDMLDSGVGPFLATDNVFLEGRCNGNQFERTPAVGDAYRKQAEAAGVDPTGKVYLSTLADYPGDPKAWVSGRGDVQKRCEQEGHGCSGLLNVPKRAPEGPPAAVAVADDLVEAHTDRRIEAEPALALRPRAEVREETVEKIKPHWS